MLLTPWNYTTSQLLTCGTSSPGWKRTHDCMRFPWHTRKKWRSVSRTFKWSFRFLSVFFLPRSLRALFWSRITRGKFSNSRPFAYIATVFFLGVCVLAYLILPLLNVNLRWYTCRKCLTSLVNKKWGQKRFSWQKQNIFCQNCEKEFLYI